MKRFREHFISKLITLVITVVFLNMSFLVAEVSMLDLHKDSEFAKIIAFIISGTCFEEERDLGTEASGEETAKKTDLLFCGQLHPHSGYVLLSVIKKYIADHRMPLPGNYETFTPPPES
jgi:hypothetical protein